ncbi:hypothetical protein [Halobacterium yunchengense]|uniref:hypothetical protein n=1 Tax=Halobacterium yunchengense TaxID=3108497 RepID=UPI00300A3DF1
MNARRAASVVLAVAAAAALATGSLGFTSASAERGVQVNVVEPEDGYVGVQACEKANGSGDGANPVRVWVTNQYTAQFTVERITTDAGDEFTPNSNRGTLDVGERESYEPLDADSELTVHVSEGLTATVNVQVDQKGDCPTKGDGGDPSSDEKRGGDGDGSQ